MIMDRFEKQHMRPATGFTLVEMTVALAIMALVAITLLESFAFGQRTYRQVRQADTSAWDVFVTQRLIRNLIESAYPRELVRNVAGSYGLEGDSGRVSILAPAPLAAKQGGFYRFELGLIEATGNRKDLVVRWWPELAAHTTSGRQDGIQQEVLITGVKALTLSFRPAAATTSDALNTAWQSRWEGQQALPALIRLKIEFDESDSRYWPELIVAPRITHDANCAFDVIAQDCRVAS